MSWFAHNLPVLAVFLILASLGWVFGGINGTYLPEFVPWLVVFAVETMLFFPQRHPYETHEEARKRVWDGVKRDPLVWITLATIIILAVPFVNKGLCPQCDAKAIATGASIDPPLPFLPFCVNRWHQLNVFLWFLPALTAMVVVRHALVRSGKRMLVAMLVWNGAAMAVLGFVQQITGARGAWWIDLHAWRADFFSTFSYPNMAGDYFTALFVLSFGVWRNNVMEVEEEEEENSNDFKVKSRSGHKRFWLRHYPLFATVLLFLAAYTTLSRAAIVFVSAAAILLAIHTMLTTLAAMKKVARVKAIALALFAVIGVVLAAIVFTPDSVRHELDSVDAVSSLDRFTGRGAYHDHIARELWLAHPVFGCGGWGYKHFGAPMIPAKYKSSFRHIWGGLGSSNVHNDYMQFLCEHGAIVVLLLVAILFYLIRPIAKIWRAMASEIRFARHTHLPSPKSFFVFPLPALAPILAALVTFLHAFGDCPLRSPAILTLFFVELACVTGYLPPLRHR